MEHVGVGQDHVHGANLRRVHYPGAVALIGVAITDSAAHRQVRAVAGDGQQRAKLVLSQRLKVDPSNVIEV